MGNKKKAFVNTDAFFYCCGLIEILITKKKPSKKMVLKSLELRF